MITIEVNNNKLEQFNRFAANLQYDTVGSSFSFESIYNKENSLHREIFTPLSYSSVVVKSGNMPIISGYSMDTNFTSSSQSNYVSVDGYSKCAIIEDISIPLELYPLQFIDLSLSQMSEKLLSPYGIKFISTSRASKLANENISEVSASPGKSIRQFLTEIASQKGLILKHDTSGNIVYDIYTPSAPVMDIKEGQNNVIKLSSKFGGRNMHSSITTLGQASLTKQGEREGTIANTIISQRRDLVKQINTVEDVDAEKAAKQIRSKELKDINITVEFDTITPNGSIILPGEVVTLQHSEIRIDNTTRFMVLQNRITVDATGERCFLKLIMEESLTGNQPVAFW